MPKTRARLDETLVGLGLAPDRKRAQALILAGRVLVEGREVRASGEPVKPGQAVELRPGARFVGRGGLKLEAALDHFAIPVEGLVCLDVGASTGGFTDCLLKRGAARVFAVDVGRGQLDWRLRRDPRVVCMERTHARSLKPSDLGGPAGFFCMDVSFISAAQLLPFVAPLLAPGGSWVVLVKPQFEARRGEVEKGGLVREAGVHRRVCAEVSGRAEDLGLGPLGTIQSPLTGAEGNLEFLLAGRKKHDLDF